MKRRERRWEDKVGGGGGRQRGKSRMMGKGESKGEKESKEGGKRG